MSRPSSPPATSAPARCSASRAKIDRGRGRHREGHGGVTQVALQDEDQDRDEAREHNCEPGDPGNVHLCIFGVRHDFPLPPGFSGITGVVSGAAGLVPEGVRVGEWPNRNAGRPFHQLDQVPSRIADI